MRLSQPPSYNYILWSELKGGSVAEWLACWTQAQKARVQMAAATLSGNSLRQTVHTHRASVHQAAKLAAGLLRAARVTAGAWRKVTAAYRRVYDSRHLQADCARTGISSGTLRSVIEYGLPGAQGLYVRGGEAYVRPPGGTDVSTD